eukprot:gene48825-65470_t
MRRRKRGCRARRRNTPRIRSKTPRLGRRRDLSTGHTPVNARGFAARRLDPFKRDGALALVLAVAACGRGGGDDRAPEPGDRAVAEVQDQTIWASDVKREAVAQGLVGEGEPLDVTSDLFRRVLDEVIDQ